MVFSRDKKPIEFAIALLIITLYQLATVSAQAEVGFAARDYEATNVDIPHADGLTAARQGGSDSDGDGVADYADNCTFVANANQRDTDQDGYGNICDTDLNNDGQTNAVDLGLLRVAFFGTPVLPNWNPHADFNGDNVTNTIDLGLMRASFFGPPGPSGMSCAGTVPCPQQRFVMNWPVPGNDADDWVINNYVDLDNGGGILDYQGGSKSYDGHRGIDIDSPTFREMDNNFPVLASAQGVVLALDESNFDRNTSCAGNWNFVTVGHPNGYKTIYGHLKQNSVVVNVGDIVQPGDQLGVLGSSGCSTAPHLHLETHDENGNVIEPFQQGLWINPPVYNTPIGFMDATLYNQSITNVNMIKDPAPNVTLVEPGTTFGIGLSMAGGAAGDNVNMQIRNNSGGLVAQNTINWPGVLRHSYWWWNYNFSTSALGPHTLQIRVNGALVRTYAFNVEEFVGGFYQVRHGVPAANYQALFNQLVANGFRPVWVDGYRSGGQSFINAIFDKSQVPSWAAAHGQSAANFQAFFNAQTQAGRRLVHVDSYRQGNDIVYASIFVEQLIGPQWIAYNGLTAAQHQAQFNNLVGQGFRASIISVVEDAGGVARYTALYDTANVGGWVALANMTSAQYNAEFANQANAGRALAYLNGYTINGATRFTAIWNSNVPASWVGVHDRTAAQFQSDFNFWTGQGLITRIVTGYDNGGTANFGGLWTN